MVIKMPRQWLHQLHEVYMPEVIANHRAFQMLHETGSKEWFTGHVLIETCKEANVLMRKKIALTTGFEPSLTFSASQVYTLFLSLKNFPIPPTLVWDTMMRNRFMREIDRYMANPDAVIKYDMTKA